MPWPMEYTSTQRVTAEETISISADSRSATRVMPSGGAKSPRWTDSGPRRSAAIIRATESASTAVSTATLMKRWNA